MTIRSTELVGDAFEEHGLRGAKADTSFRNAGSRPVATPEEER